MGAGECQSSPTGGRHAALEAVIDKDLTAALLAITVRADCLLVLTDVLAVMAHFGTPQAVPLRTLDLDELNDMQFPAGSMGPKIAACRESVAATGRPAAIGSLSDPTAILAASAGTTITSGGTPNNDPRSQTPARAAPA